MPPIFARGARVRVIKTPLISTPGVGHGDTGVIHIDVGVLPLFGRCYHVMFPDTACPVYEYFLSSDCLEPLD